MSRAVRSFLASVTTLLFAASLAAAKEPSVVVLGVDGMDPHLLESAMAKGRMPNFQRLMRTGSFSTLETSIPPQSPVAWSNFITGMDPGGHGIFDFIHQDRTNYMPTFSTALVAGTERTFKLGRWVIPLSRGKVDLLRRGAAFWQLLDTREVTYLVFQIPANFPPAESRGVSVSGMGTPDLLGTYGTFSFYTDDPTLMSLDVSGGKIYPVRVEGTRIDAFLHGPENSMLAGRPELTLPLTVHIDRENRTALIDLADREILLEEGEWSDWIQVRFEVLQPFWSLSGIARLYLKSVAPYVQLYVTPLNIDPRDPALPISSDHRFMRKLSEKVGYFHTEGMPEDTKALEWGMFTDAEFVAQTEQISREQIGILDALLDDYRGGLLFFYFSWIDQSSHMLWRNMDPKHPAHTLESERFAGRIEDLYARIDSIVGAVESRLPDDATLIVMSDHGFAPYYKKVNLNTWLYENGYVELKDPGQIGNRDVLFRNVLWRRTRAFGLGINGLYANLRGREAQGVVKSGLEHDELLADITAGLLAYRDAETGEAVVSRVYRSSEVYHGAAVGTAPDLVVGYARGYRGSDDTAIGGFSKQVIMPNLDKWSGDHCIAHDEVPGILLCNRPLRAEDPSLLDLAVTVLGLYGIKPGPDMKGRVLFDAGDERAASIDE
jgi:predicted AlkP superfamily phosphohydrolase/phosphomutase